MIQTCSIIAARMGWALTSIQLFARSGPSPRVSNAKSIAEFNFGGQALDVS
jgi:hypothetical protein